MDKDPVSWKPFLPFWVESGSMTNALFLEEESIPLQKKGDKQYDHCIGFVRCHVLTLTARKDPRGLTTLYPDDAAGSICNIECVFISYESEQLVVYLESLQRCCSPRP